ncbi:MAG: dihydrofolate reductase family protein [Pseudomonadota bacterium]
MQPIIYDVAVSLDGFICGDNEDVSHFPHEGPIVDAYRKRLDSYAVCLMGRRTYEFGYRFGLPAGANPYPGMQSYVISASLELPGEAEVSPIRRNTEAVLRRLKVEAAGSIYLCGGGALAGSLLELGLIDKVRLKRAPIVLGKGVRLFGAYERLLNLRQLDMVAYPDGTVFQEFEIPTG